LAACQGKVAIPAATATSDLLPTDEPKLIPSLAVDDVKIQSIARILMPCTRPIGYFYGLEKQWFRELVFFWR